MTQAKIKFWGVRGSLSVGPSQYGNQTSCVELDFGDGNSVFFDAGTGIRSATFGRKFSQLTLCLSHFHWDHIQGLPYASFLEDSKSQVLLLTGFSDLWERLGVLFDTRFHPVSLESLKECFKEKILTFKDSFKHPFGKIRLGPLHHPGTSYAFEFQGSKGKFVYSTDTDFDPLTPEAADLLKNADWAVLDSQYLIGDSLQKAHYGHSSFKKAIDVAAQARVRNVFLFHYDPNYSDQDLENLEKQAVDYCRSSYGRDGPQIQMAREGTEIDVQI